MNAVPVWLGYQYGGLAECTGLLRDGGDDLVLEYQSKEALIGDMLRSSVRHARIPSHLICSMVLKKPWLGLKTQLVIRTTTMGPLADVPGMSGGMLVLGVAKTDRLAAEQLVADFSMRTPTLAKPTRLDSDFG